MPAKFDACVRNGGKITTKKLSGGRYQHICWIGGQSFKGHIKKKKVKK
ncbi:unnamed protein product [marine sediment metagenome]|uniref:Uncharacterized protein n=1 Tax=marine sediment metagenome TaxID=412755 RepID=X1DB14_9ZZZZ